MRSKFTAPKTETVTITRSDETVSLTLTAPPASYGPFIAACMPEPVVYRDGKPSAERDPRSDEWSDLRFYVLLAKALEPTGELESVRKGDQPMHWERFARDVRAEFQAAGFTDGDMLGLMKAMNRLRFGGDAPEVDGTED